MRVVYIDPPSEGLLSQLRATSRIAVGALRSSSPLEQKTPAFAEFDAIITATLSLSEAMQLRRDTLVIVPRSSLPPSLRMVLGRSAVTTVCRVPFATEDTAEMTLALVLAASKQLVLGDKLMRAGRWLRSSVTTVRFSKALIVGFGLVGQSIAKKLKSFGVQCVVIARSDKTRSLADASGYSFHTPSEMDSLLPSCDIVVLCLPDTRATTHLIGVKQLQLLSDHTILVNVGRPSSIDLVSLASILKVRPGVIAGLEVWPDEPEGYAIPGGHVSELFRDCDNVILSPHRAWRSSDAALNRVQLIASQLRAWEAGRVPEYIVTDVAHGM